MIPGARCCPVSAHRLTSTNRSRRTSFMKNSRFQISHLATELSRKIFLASVTALLLCMPLPKSALASAGGLDLTFGNQGKVETDFFGNVEVVSGLALQPDGKIIAAGGAAFPNNVGNFALARYNSSGALDFTFGSGGKVTTPFATSISSIQGVVLQPDGKIVAVGAADNNL